MKIGIQHVFCFSLCLFLSVPLSHTHFLSLFFNGIVYLYRYLVSLLKEQLRIDRSIVKSTEMRETVF